VTNFKVKIRILKESYQDLVVGKPSYSPFRPGMITVDIITKTREKCLSVVKPVVIKLSLQQLRRGENEGSY
jgi:HlyD family secretion protein